MAGVVQGGAGETLVLWARHLSLQEGEFPGDRRWQEGATCGASWSQVLLDGGMDTRQASVHPNHKTSPTGNVGSLEM